MRKIQHLLLTAAMLLVSLVASAQAKMTIELKNGTSLSFYVSEIEKISWTDGTDTPSEGDNEPDDQIVKGKPVDLGLPSGIKWADMNVGASKPEEYGDYFAWGETEPYYTAGHSQDNPCSNWKTGKTGYNWDSYKWCNGSFGTQTKYCTSSSYGTVDGKTVLDPEDDVAHVKWGGDWRMPTREEQDELLTKCSWKWTTSGGVNGYVVTGPNGNSIFLPAAGGRYDSSLDSAGYCGLVYWSSSLDEGNSGYACSLYFYSSYGDWNYYRRCYGFSVRPVCP